MRRNKAADARLQARGGIARVHAYASRGWRVRERCIAQQ
jgi:hypothetical protein